MPPDKSELNAQALTENDTEKSTALQGKPVCSGTKSCRWMGNPYPNQVVVLALFSPRHSPVHKKTPAH